MNVSTPAGRYVFRWRRPNALIYRVAEPHLFRVSLNRYPGIVIGLGIQILGRALSVVWGRPEWTKS